MVRKNNRFVKTVLIMNAFTEMRGERALKKKCDRVLTVLTCDRPVHLPTHGHLVTTSFTSFPVSRA